MPPYSLIPEYGALGAAAKRCEPMKIRHLNPVALLCALALGSAAALAASLEGQRFDDTTRVANSELVLNGLGLEDGLKSLAR